MSLQITAFSHIKGNGTSFLIQNMILMVFKLYVYKLSISGTLNFNRFLHYFIKVKNLAKGAVFNNKQKRHVFKEMVFHRKSVATIKNLSSVYNMNNNSLTEAETIGGCWSCFFFNFYFVNFVFS